ncbi:HAD-IA family hydrolase [Candidatus Shapirobacteria bacterium]|nr:HAD-IA family hydrolase [Candidatus Shapirobacteria bacterium]
MNFSENKEIMGFETFLFDWDGCLAKTLQNWLDTYRFIYKKYGVYTKDEDILHNSWGNLAKGPEYFGIKNYDEVWAEIVIMVAEKNKNVALYENVTTLLETLRNAGKKLAIVTSSEMKIVKPAIEYNKLVGFENNIFTEEMVSQPKPDPEIVNLAVEKLNGKKETTIIIGDTAKDILAGKAAGIKTVLVSHPENGLFYDLEKMKECGPDFVVEGF